LAAVAAADSILKNSLASEERQMKMPRWILAPILVVTPLALSSRLARGEDIPKKYRPAVNKALDWLEKNQRRDGSWVGEDGMYATPMTALGGMAMLAQGSTLREGKYRNNLRRAADWLQKRAQPNGLIGNPAVPSEGRSYMYGHGFAMLFLSCLVGEEDNRQRRKDLVQILDKATVFTHKAQTKRGGWGYTSAKDLNDFDEGSVTITQLQGLRAARNAGIAVPGKCIQDARKYLEKSTNPDGGIKYSLTFDSGPSRPALTAAAICCGFSAGDYDSPLIKKWFNYCRTHIQLPDGSRRMGHDEYINLYYAQVIYVLGDDRFAKLFPDVPANERLTWTKYRNGLFDELIQAQSNDGSWGVGNWTAQGVGKTYVTAVYAIVMQLDRAALPIFQR
jgi:hypothetical protein